MENRRIVKGLLVLMAAMLFVQAQAQSLIRKYERWLTTPRSYVAYRTTSKPVIDGRMTEADWQRAAWTEDFEDISGAGFARPKYLTRAKMMWDDDFFYVAAELEEPHITATLTRHDAIIYHDNDFEVFIDPDDDNECYYEIEVNAFNTLFELMLNRPYRNEGNFFDQWDCPGLKTAVYIDGTLNDKRDKDRSWTVEMAIPKNALKTSFEHPLKAGSCWRVNFSRVEWLSKPEENWVWSATGAVNMHMPERWGYLYFSGKTVGQGTDEVVWPHDMNVYKLMWAVYYAQEEAKEKTGKYLQRLADLGLSEEDKALLPGGSQLRLEATDTMFKITVNTRKESYSLDHNSRFVKKNLKETR